MSFSLFRWMVAVPVVALVLMCGACSDQKVHESVEDCALAWAKSFYSFDFKRVENLCAPGSTNWLKLYTSNISDADLEAIHNVTGRPRVAIESVTPTGDNAAIARVRVENAYVMTMALDSGHVVNNMIVKIRLEKDAEGLWYVKMVGLPQSEM